MKIAVFSDIHGNLPAWRSALEQMRAWGAQRHVFLGDLCGYYYGQLDILPELLSLPGLVAVRGNHDQTFLDILAGDEAARDRYARTCGSSMERLLAQPHDALAQWLLSLPRTAVAEGAFCAHGSPAAPLEGYVYPDTPLAAHGLGGEGLHLLGHTHYRMHRQENAALVVNPGSLGQPRDGGHASWAAWETEGNTVRFADVRFDTTELARQAQQADRDFPYLCSVLGRIPGEA